MYLKHCKMDNLWLTYLLNEKLRKTVKIQRVKTLPQNSRLEWKRRKPELCRVWTGMRGLSTKKVLPAEKEWPHTEGWTLESVSYNSVLPSEIKTVSPTMTKTLRNYTSLCFLIRVLIDGRQQHDRNVCPITKAP